MTSIFTKIIRWEIPCHKIYEDEKIFAFLDIRPLHMWHTLVVPKSEIGHILDMEDVLYTHLMLVAKNTIAPAIQKSTWCNRIGFMVEWFWVPDHAHLHLIPLNTIGDFDPSLAHEVSPESMQTLAHTIQANILQ